MLRFPVYYTVDFIITCYLQSRVVYHQKGERNFHAFYQLLFGLPDDKINEFSLERNPGKYEFLKYGQSDKVNWNNYHLSLEI